MPVGKQQVERTAKLARLKLSPVEIEQLTHDLSTIVDYFQKLSEVDTSEMPLHAEQEDGPGALRDDCVGDSLPRDEALSGAPEQDGEFFLVPKVIG